MTTILVLFFFIFGLIIGSFLNVVIFRLNTQKSFGGRSACMSCQNTLSWYELFPVVSFCVQGGRCRNCKTKVSVQYPLVELATGFIFALLFVKFQYLFFANTLSFAFSYAFYASILSLLLVIAVYDIKHKIIPDTLSLFFGVMAFVGLFLFDSSGFNSGVYLHIPTLLEFLSGAFLSLPFALIWLFSRGSWMGLGDAKLAVGLGFLLGPAKILSGAVLAFWSGAIIGLLLMMLSSKYKMKTEIPFAPFLVLGTMLAFFFEFYLFPIGI
jgi:prepilin signal peptidase PulO-like enzyme (type II secretory pathway)